MGGCDTCNTYSEVTEVKGVYALVDCNNFYISCERVFNPSLRRSPVVVLSNNDGNVVARSDEVKRMGMPFGEPYFKLKPLIKKEGIAVFSSNYTLYGDMSRRVMECLATFTPDMEIYSIDEAFLLLGDTGPGIHPLGKTIRETVKQWTGIPVSVGIGPTKTLAKLANRIAKRNPSYCGTFNICSHPETDALLHSIEVSGVWGVGRQYTKLLNRNGIHTALHLRDAPDKWIKKNMTIMGLRTVHELRGIPCIPLEEAPPPKQGIVCSRSFGTPVRDLNQLREALASYTSRGAEKLRLEKSIASFITVFITTNPFTGDPQYSNAAGCRIPVATSHTPLLMGCARGLLEKIYRKGYRYKKVGVMLSDIIPENEAQLDLFSPFGKMEENRSLMRTLDRINRSMGRGSLTFAAEGIAKKWQMRRAFLSKRYTTRWDEIPVVKA